MLSQENFTVKLKSQVEKSICISEKYGKKSEKMVFWIETQVKQK